MTAAVKKNFKKIWGFGRFFFMINYSRNSFLLKIGGGEGGCRIVLEK